MNDPKPSKSSRKREYLALQELGEQLLALRPQQLAGIETDDGLIEQVLEAQKIRSHSALRRQKQLIGKTMRQLDPEPIRAALARIGSSDQASKAIFREAEQWRDRISEGGSAELERFNRELGQHNSLMQELVEELNSCINIDQQRLVRRKVFKEIHRLLLAKMQKPVA